VVLRGGYKARPIPLPEGGGHWVVDDPSSVDLVEVAAKRVSGARDLNLAISLNPSPSTHVLSSPLVAVGVDLYKAGGKEAGELVKGFGVSSTAPVWCYRSGRGGLTVLYRRPWQAGLVWRTTEPWGVPIDLLADGLCTVPPSCSCQEEPKNGMPGGGPYQWVKGHSPLDLVICDLDYPPDGLLDYWLRAQRIVSLPQRRGASIVSAETIRKALQCQRPRCPCQSERGNVHCPAHEDADPSFNVVERGGKVLVVCFGGCDQDSVVLALKERGLWDGSRPHAGITGQQGERNLLLGGNA
jgi:hypothetical protein